MASDKRIEDYLHNEEWKPIIGYCNLYKVSDKGRIKGRRKAVFGSKTNYGYYRIWLWNGEKFVQVMVHRLVAETFLGKEENKEVNHKNGIKSDNRIENLEWVTRSENSIHAYKNNLRKANPVIGEQNYGSKLTDAQVISIRAEYQNTKTSFVKLSVKYSVAASVIERIIKRKSWKHVA